MGVLRGINYRATMPIVPPLVTFMSLHVSNTVVRYADYSLLYGINDGTSQSDEHRLSQGLNPIHGLECLL